MQKETSWYQIGPGNIPPTLPNKNEPILSQGITKSGQSIRGGDADRGDFDEDALHSDSEIDLVPVFSRPVQVTRKNKLICTFAYIILISGMIGYLVLLALFHSWYSEVKDYYQQFFIAIYVVFGSDFIAGGIGIWTCLAKTGPKPMIYACGWLLLSGLIDLCVAVSLTYEHDSLAQRRKLKCSSGAQDTEGCLVFSRITLAIWLSLTFVVAKGVVVFLCRVNYPQVFNWLAGKEVLVQDNIIIEQSEHLTTAQRVGAVFHNPPDVNVLTARGAIGGTVRRSQDEKTIIVTKFNQGELEDGEPLHKEGSFYI